MNQKCKVCGEPAAGFHFGAFTCEGCKSFFGRSYNNLGSISECKNNGECVINKKNRTACKACRLRKCLLVGMSKSGSRYGRRSNWFKIHCLLQEQQQAAMASFKGKSPEQSFSLPFPPPFLHPENSSSISSPDSESSEKGPPTFLPMPFPSMFLRPSPFLLHPHVFPYSSPPIKTEPTYPPSEDDLPKPLLNNNNYDSKNNNLEKNPKRFYLDAILGLNGEKSPSPPTALRKDEVEDDEEEDISVNEEKQGQDIPIDLSVRSTNRERPDVPITTISAYPLQETKAIPLDLSV